jgi:hypothetical protein
MEATQSALASGGAALTENERSEALHDARRRAHGALTLGELADAVQRVQTSRTSLEFEDALQAATKHAVAAPGRPRRWLIVILVGYSQKGVGGSAAACGW